MLTVWLPLFLLALVGFLSGFFLGEKNCAKATERRWAEAVARAADARDRAAERHLECQRCRLGEAEQVGRLLGIIEGLKRGECWCSVGKRKESERHSPTCVAAANAVGVKL